MKKVQVAQKPIRLSFTDSEQEGCYKIDTPFYVMDYVPKNKLEWAVGPFAGISYMLEVEGLDKEVEDHVRKLAIDYTTWAQYLQHKEVRYENYFINLQKLHNDYPINNLKGSLNGTGNVLFVGGGQSTLDEIDNIKKIIDDKSALVIAGGTGIRLLLERGIQPHMALAYDGFETEWTHVFSKFDSKLTKDIPLICYLALNPKCYDYWKGPKIIIGGQESFSNKSGIDGIDHLSEGGSGVSTAILHIANYMAANSLYYIGLDLSFVEKDGKIYSHAGIEMKDTSKVIEMQDPVTGEMKKTTRIFAKEYHFLTRNKFKTLKLFNCSKIGFNIHGFEKIDIKDIPTQEYKLDIGKAFSRADKKRIDKNLKKVKTELGVIADRGITPATKNTLIYTVIFAPYDAVQMYRETWTRVYDDSHIKLLAKSLYEVIDEK